MLRRLRQVLGRAKPQHQLPQAAAQRAKRPTAALAVQPARGLATSAPSTKKAKTATGKKDDGLLPWPGCIVVGLGNPDAKYSRTRHNVGFMVSDEFAKRHSLTWGTVKTTRGLSCSFELHNRPVHLLKPTTYMNLSGESLSKYLRHIRKLAGPSYRVGPDNVLIVHDFLDQPFGQLKLKTSGSAGGHNGLKNIQLKLSSSDYHRLRVGIGRPDSDVARFVLQPFSGTHRAQLPSVINNSCNALELYFQTPSVANVMNEINQKSGTYQVE